MIVKPYRVITFPYRSSEKYYSLIQKYYEIGGFYTMTDTRKLNVGPILPQSEAKLLNRINTILVFS